MSAWATQTWAGAGLGVYASSSRAGRGYDGARKSRLHRERDTSGGRAETHLDQQTLWQLRETARDLRRSNGLFRGILGTVKRNVIGPVGYTLKADDDLAAWWAGWSRRCDARRRQNFWGLVKLALYSQVLDGDHFWALDPEFRGGRIMPLPGDRVLTPTPADDRVVHGIDTDRDGVPVRYFVANSVPSRSAFSAAGPNVRDTEGAWVRGDRIRHWCLWDEELADSLRGEPVGGVMSRELDDLESLIVSTRVAAAMQARVPIIIEKTQNADLYAQEMADRNPDEQEEDHPPIETLEPGEVQYVNRHESAKPMGSTQPNANIPEFVQLLCRLIGAAVGLPLELILLDFTRGNFSASRLAIEQAKETFRNLQQSTLGHVEDVFVWAVMLAVKSGEFGAPSNFDPRRLANAKWLVPGWPYVDPLKDVKADAAAVQLGTMSRQRIAARAGQDWWDIAQELGDEAQELAKRGVVTGFVDPAGDPGEGANDQ